MSLKLTNNAWSILAGAITTGSLTIIVTTGQGTRFPVTSASDYFYATLADALGNIEIVKVTTRAADTMTVLRGQDGTTALAFALGDKFELRPVAANFNAKLDIVDATATYAPLISPALTGIPIAPTAAPGTNTTQIASTAFVAAYAATAVATYAPLASPALTGTPTAPTQTAGDNTTKLANTAFVAAYAATAVATYAPSASPALTGTPIAPTAAPGTNTTQIASTAFVAAINALTNANFASYAPLASPALTGTPVAPTAAPGTNTTQIATMAAIMAQAFLTALPNQAGNAGKFPQTDGATVIWKSLMGRIFYSQGG